MPELVPRPALVGRLTVAQTATLAFIIAPPGYGKTSLLSEWAEHDTRPFVWLTLNSSGDSRRMVTSLSKLIKTVRSQRCSCVVALDDAHLVAPEVVREVIESVLKELPQGSMFALASRTEPELPVGRLRAHRAIVEIRMHDLAMTPPEAAVLLRSAGLELDPQDVHTLVRCTEGWPAALYLAALSLLEDPDALAHLGGFRGDDHLLSEYLRDEVLSALPEKLLSFLRRTSVLDQLNGAVCDAVLQSRGSARILAELGSTTQLLEPLDPAHDSYRWHPLFRDSLLGEQHRTGPELEPQLRLRASIWYEEHGDTDRAIEQAAQAGDAERTGELLSKHLVSYLAQGRNHQVGNWLRHFSHDQIAHSAPMALCAAHSGLVRGAIEEAQRWALSAAAASERDPAGESVPSTAAGLAVLEAMLARSGAIGMRQAAERAHALAPADSEWHPLSCAVRGVAEHLVGDRAAATRLLEEAIDLGGDTMPLPTAICLAQCAMIAGEQNDWALATELTDRGARLITDHGLARDPMTALAFAASAAARAHQGRVDEAKRDLRRAVDLLEKLGSFVSWYGAEARLLLAHASLWLADIAGARTLLAQASRLARRTPDAVVFDHWFEDAWSYMDTLAETNLAGVSSLTIAELRILRFLPSHRSFREIAAQLGVSANTVKTQAHAVYRKLGAASRSEAVARALDAGLLGQ